VPGGSAIRRISVQKAFDVILSVNQRPGFASVLWSSCLAMLAVGANGTAIMAALPTMQTELFLSSAGVQWAVNAYLVASAACIVLGGQAADRFGARLASMVGLALFGVASCIIAIADTQVAFRRECPFGRIP
jgi:MFS family permease